MGKADGASGSLRSNYRALLVCYLVSDFYLPHSPGCQRIAVGSLKLRMSLQLPMSYCKQLLCHFSLVQCQLPKSHAKISKQLHPRKVKDMATSR
jgi:hypothetical protein